MCVCPPPHLSLLLRGFEEQSVDYSDGVGLDVLVAPAVRQQDMRGTVENMLEHAGERWRTLCACACFLSPLQVRDELSDGDLLRHLLVEVLAVEHHRLQDGQRPLQHRRVHGRLVHEAGDLHTPGREGGVNEEGEWVERGREGEGDGWVD